MPYLLNILDSSIIPRAFTPSGATMLLISLYWVIDRLPKLVPDRRCPRHLPLPFVSNDELEAAGRCPAISDPLRMIGQ